MSSSVNLCPWHRSVWLFQDYQDNQDTGFKHIVLFFVCIPHTEELEGSVVDVSVLAVCPSSPRKTDCSNQESRLDNTAGVKFLENWFKFTHTHTTGGNSVDCCCIKQFHDVNDCVHNPAPPAVFTSDWCWTQECVVGRSTQMNQG